MHIKHVTKHLVDIFLDTDNPVPTGFEPSCWLRLAKRGNTWVQTGGIRVPSWQFKKIVGSL